LRSSALQAIVSTSAVEMRDKTRTYSALQAIVFTSAVEMRDKTRTHSALQAIAFTSAVEMRDKTRTYSVPRDSDQSRHAIERIAADHLHDQRRDARQNKVSEHVG